MREKNWSTFLLALGLFFIMISPAVPLKYPLMTTGGILVVSGIYAIKRHKKKK